MISPISNDYNHCGDTSIITYQKNNCQKREDMHIFNKK